MFKLVKTCGGCPEQYDVYYNGKEVGYMRLRHGNFRAEYRGETVYTARPNGDGVFEYDERDKYLQRGCLAIKEAMKKDGMDKNFLFEVVSPNFDEGEIGDMG